MKIREASSQEVVCVPPHPDLLPARVWREYSFDADPTKTSVGTIQFAGQSYSHNLPEPRDGVLLIVPLNVYEAMSPYRADLVKPFKPSKNATSGGLNYMTYDGD